MSEYNPKYKLDQQMYFFYDKKIHKQPIQKIRILHQHPHKAFDATNNVVEKSGIEIEYLFLVYQKENISSSNWFKEEELFATKDELIAQIV